MNFTILRSYQKKIKKRKSGSHQQLNCVKKVSLPITLTVHLELEKLRAKQAMEERRKAKKDYQNNLMNLTDKMNRKWLCKHGKADKLSFSDNQIRQLKNCFDSLDDDHTSSIGVAELQEPLIGLGFADTVS